MMKDKKKLREHKRAYYHRNVEKFRKRDRERKARARALVESLKTECAMCGFNNRLALVFHHNDPDKKSFKVADMIKAGANLERLLEEIKKCTVLCANCHTILHKTVAIL